MEKYVLFLKEINKTHISFVGGKGANLGEITQAGFPVPPGFCITTQAYRKFTQAREDQVTSYKEITEKEFNDNHLSTLLDELDRIASNEIQQIQTLGQRIREHLESLVIPDDIKEEIIAAWKVIGEDKSYAVRSSATAEDLQGASFAGQQDTYLNICGEEQLLQAVKRCWASLFTDRAIVYRAKNGFDHQKVQMSVVVQRMVFPEVSGIMFTADPITGHRKTIAIDASFGLGEALVSGLVSADMYRVRDGRIIHKQISQKKMAIEAVPGGGTIRRDLSQEQQISQALSDEKILELAEWGQKIAAHYDTEQDIEWCWAEGEFFIVQSRPITTLYPVPLVSDDKLHLFLSFGHVQMMMEAMKPLGISVIRTLLPFGKETLQDESPYVVEAGSRLYIDTAGLLQYPRIQKALPDILSNIEEMFGRSVTEFCTREEYRSQLPAVKKMSVSLLKPVAPIVFSVLRNLLYRHDARAMAQIDQFMQDNIQESKCMLEGAFGAARISLIQQRLSKMIIQTFKNVAPYIGAGVGSYIIINKLTRKWLGDVEELGSISKSPPGNVTTEMGLFLGDVADAIRPYPDVIAYLRGAGHVNGTNQREFLEGLHAVHGGEEVLPIFTALMDRYGMRGSGEIDITRPRWQEVPAQYIPAILNYVEHSKPGQHRLDFEAGQIEADAAVAKLLARLRKTPGGRFKVRLLGHLIKAHRAVIGIREHPKYLIVQTLGIIKKKILEDASKLVEIGILSDAEDIFWFSLEEIKGIYFAVDSAENTIKINNTHSIKDLKETCQFYQEIIARRREKYLHDALLNAPRAITSEGEIITPKPAVPSEPGDLVGSAVSAGTAEGRARVILKLEDAHMEKGDILVAPYTDPAWTPLFPLAAGLVTEVGGLMTHGAVVAREYGIPAVVGVDNATSRIKDGQMIRVDGTRGIINLLGS